ncbi:DUF2975 domain-containing protein [bacterium]
MKCNQCGEDFPSKHYFPIEGICKSCFKKLDPEKKRILQEKIDRQAEKEVVHSRLARVLQGFLGLAQVLFIMGAVLILLSYGFLMIRGEMEINTHEWFQMLYQLTPIQERALFEITSAPSIMSDPELILLGGVRFTVQDRAFITMYMLMLFFMVGAGFIIIRQLHGLLGTVATKQFFIMRNIKRIRIIGWIIIISQVFLILWGVPLVFLLNGISVSGMKVSGFHNYWIDGVSNAGNEIFIGLVVLCLAEIFRLGTKLREEQEMTI